VHEVPPKSEEGAFAALQPFVLLQRMLPGCRGNRVVPSLRPKDRGGIASCVVNAICKEFLRLQKDVKWRTGNVYRHKK
jgi:hypothetical protein